MLYRFMQSLSTAPRKRVISPYPHLPPHPILTFFGGGGAYGCGKPGLIMILRGAVLSAPGLMAARLTADR